MTTTRDVVELCKKIRYDLTAAQGKLSDVIQALEGANMPLSEPLPAAVRLARQIVNGVIRDEVALDAELRAEGALSELERDELRRFFVARCELIEP